MIKLYNLLTTVLTFCFTQAVAQVPDTPINYGHFGPEKIVVELDSLTNIPNKELPYDRTFFIKKYMKKSMAPLDIATVVEVKSFAKRQYLLESLKMPDTKSEDGGEKKRALTSPIETKCFPAEKGNGQYDAYYISVSPLKPGKSYDLWLFYNFNDAQNEKLVNAFIAYHEQSFLAAPCFDQVIQIINQLNIEKKNNLDAIFIKDDEFKEYYTQFVKPTLPSQTVSWQERDDLLKSLKDQQPLVTQDGYSSFIFTNASKLSAVGETRAYKLEARASSWIQPDFGAVFYGIGGGKGGLQLSDSFWGIAPYIGANILFRSYDPDIAFRPYINRRVNFFQRLSLHFGLTLLSLSKANQRENLFNGFNLLTGVGYRLNSAIKVQGGVLYYRKLSQNPLIPGSDHKPIGYLGLSFDLNVRKALGDIGELLFKK